MEIKGVKIHFIICLQRTGSSMLTLMLNVNDKILSTAEEPFALYFYNKYKSKTHWSMSDIEKFLYELELSSEDTRKYRNLSLFFSSKEEIKEFLAPHLPEINYEDLCKLIYLQFHPTKNKSYVKTIIDKQIKYMYNLKKVRKIFPESKFLILIRDYRDVIYSWKKRKLGVSDNVAYLSKIWDLSYKKALDFSKKNSDICTLIRYEDLVSDPENTLRNICSFFNVEYNNSMLKHNKILEEYLEKNSHKVDHETLNRFKEFHSNTLQPVNPSLINQWEKTLTKKEISIAEKIAGKTGLEAGYKTISDIKNTKLSAKEKYYLAKVFYDYSVRQRIYMLLPLNLKTLLKKVKMFILRQ